MVEQRGSAVPAFGKIDVETAVAHRMVVGVRPRPGGFMSD
jgi:hypothetical protein